MEWTEYFEKWPTPVMHMVFFRQELWGQLSTKEAKGYQ